MFDKLKNMSRTQIVTYLSILIIFILLIIYLVKYFKTKSIKEFINTNGFKINNHSSHIVKTIDNNKLKEPLLDNEFTYSFYLFIDNFYENMNFWKHIFHKGTLIKQNETMEYKEWKEVENEIPEQSVGVWLHNNVNDLRIAVTTDNKYDKLEYIDIHNIHSNTWIHFTVIIKSYYIEVYKNGQLLNTRVFKDKPLFNKKDLYFTHKKTYDGKIKNFNYVPKALSLDDIQSLEKK